MDAAETPALRKARGAFFTPEPLCRYLADWAIRSPSDRVLEPSCGDAAFLLAAGEGLRARGAVIPQLAGVEVHEASSVEAHQRLAAAGLVADIRVASFFDVEPAERFEVVLGNPPYVRYQDFVGSSRTKSRKLALASQVSLTGLASSWAAFTVHAASFVSDQGRLGLVLPAELLTVNYAAEVRSFLLRRFARVRLVMFTERVFPGVSEEVVLLLAEGTGGTDHFELYQPTDLADLQRPEPAHRRWAPPSHSGKWLGALLGTDASVIYAELTAPDRFASLAEWGDTTLGMVTGNNSYFALTDADAASWQFRPSELIRISPPGSRHLRQLTFTATRWQAMAAASQRVWLFRPEATDPTDLSASARRFISNGQANGVDGAYKCRVRSPWWRVPLGAAPDLFVTYMNHHGPQLATNRARTHHLNSVHGVRLTPEHRTLGMSLLPLASLNTATMLGAELVGRAYGGGILKLEPKEADLLPVPAPGLLAEHHAELTKVRSRAGALLAAGCLAEATQVVDEIILTRALHVSAGDLADLRAARAALFHRRSARAGKNP